MSKPSSLADLHARVLSRPAWILMLLALVLLAAPTPAAHAGIITVRAYGDGAADASRCPGSNCRLRDAIAAANNGDTITFGSANHTIALTQGQLTLDKDLTISFNGAVGDIVIDALSASRVFNIPAGTTATLDTLFLQNGSAAAGNNGGAIRVAAGAILNLNNVTVEFSQVNGSGDLGGAIYNAGTLNINNFAFFMNNQTAAGGMGGAIYNAGTATFGGTIFSDGSRSISFLGSSATKGGAIFNDGSMAAGEIQVKSSNSDGGGAVFNNGTLSLEQSLVVGNHAHGTGANQGFGGGIENSPFGTLTIADSSISSNTAEHGGAGVSNSTAAALTVRRSLIDNNAASNGIISMGGGILNSGSMTLTNVTLSGNLAQLDGGGILNGEGGVADLNNVTLTNNTADTDGDDNGEGGGIYMGCPSGLLCISRPFTATVQNSILAGNSDASPSTKYPDCSGKLVSHGYNLLRIDAGCVGLSNGVNGDQVGTVASPRNALLAALAANGGLTPTHALLPASPALDAGNPAAPGSGGSACAVLDQRGYPRAGGAGRCDIGAYERVFLQLLPLVVR